MNKIPDNQKIVHIAHIPDGGKFIIHAGLKVLGHLISVALNQSLLTQVAQVGFRLITLGNLIFRNLLLPEDNLHITSLCDLMGVLQSLQGIGKQTPHLLF